MMLQSFATAPVHPWSRCMTLGCRLWTGGELACVCMLDMSAVFDVVDHDILLDKLDLYGFDGRAVLWIVDEELSVRNNPGCLY